MDSEFGNFTKNPDNETHIGSAEVEFIRKIPRFVDTKVLMSSGHVILNKTITLCDEKSVKKFRAFLVRSIGIFGTPDPNAAQRQPPPEIKCPLQEVLKIFYWVFIQVFKFQGIITFGALERSIDLPMLVPSFLASPGNYELFSSFNIITGREVKSVLSSLLRFQIQQIKN